LWCDSCAWLSGTWLVFHIAVATAETHHPPLHCANIQFVLHKRSASVDEHHWMQFFPHEGIQLHTFASYAFPCQMPFCQTARLLLSVAWQQNLTEYWWEGSTPTATSPTSASDIVRQHNKRGGINFGATLII